MNYEIFYTGVAASLVYSLIGVTILLAAYWLVERLTPENSWEEIVKNKNVALAVVFAAFIIGISIIIAAAIHG